jgi:hypothetical protein
MLLAYHQPAVKTTGNQKLCFESALKYNLTWPHNDDDDDDDENNVTLLLLLLLLILLFN